MVNPTFTPGPWEVFDDGLILSPNGWEVASVPMYAETPVAEWNAHLIAAAPELYEAVRLFVEEYDAGDQADGVAMMLAYNAALEAGQAALAKARGEA